MKKALLLLPIFFIAISSFAQAGIDDVISAMKSGNASGVTKFFDSYVDITIDDKGSNYSRSQGELIFKDKLALALAIITALVRHCNIDIAIKILCNS